MLKIYAYQGCSTCRAAVKWLQSHAIPFQEVAIREHPPTVDELRLMLDAREGDIRSLCNTSGLDYRSMGMKDRLPKMSQEEVLALLAEHGNLVKRPFALDVSRGIFLVGFKEAEWDAALRVTPVS